MDQCNFPSHQVPNVSQSDELVPTTGRITRNLEIRREALVLGDGQLTRRFENQNVRVTPLQILKIKIAGANSENLRLRSRMAASR